MGQQYQHFAIYRFSTCATDRPIQVSRMNY